MGNLNSKAELQCIIKEYDMWGRIIDWYGGVPYKPPKRRKIMKPNPHYVNMIINFSILGTLIYVAIQVS